MKTSRLLPAFRIAPLLTVALACMFLGEAARSASSMDRWKEPFPQPPALTSEDRKSVLKLIARMKDERLKDGSEPLLRSDAFCDHNQADIESTILPASDSDLAVCEGRDRVVVWLASTQGLYACREGKVVSAMRSSIGSGGIGKQKEGDKKTPIGSYWLGPPRSSKTFGIFIPVGYPNFEDLTKGRTGSSIGIHSLDRIPGWENPTSPGDACDVGRLKTNWTIGCLAVARDEQITELAAWVVANWPVRLLTIDDRAARPSRAQRQ